MNDTLHGRRGQLSEDNRIDFIKTSIFDKNYTKSKKTVLKCAEISEPFLNFLIFFSLNNNICLTYGLEFGMI